MENRKKLLLLVEDEPDLMEAIKLKLEREKEIEVVGVGSGEEALVFVKNHKPDLVWLDNLLPGMSGLEVLEKIRNDAALNDIPVVMVSVSAGDEKIKRAFSLRVIDYIVKSEHSLDEIVQKVKAFLKLA